MKAFHPYLSIAGVLSLMLVGITSLSAQTGRITMPHNSTHDNSATSFAADCCVASARPIHAVFGSLLTCFDSTGFVYVENDGAEPVQLVGITPSYAPEFSA